MLLPGEAAIHLVAASCKPNVTVGENLHRSQTASINIPENPAHSSNCDFQRTEDNDLFLRGICPYNTIKTNYSQLFGHWKVKRPSILISLKMKSGVLENATFSFCTVCHIESFYSLSWP